MTSSTPVRGRSLGRTARRIAIVALATQVGAGSLLLGAAQPGQAEPAGANVRVALTSDIDTFNPFLNIFATSFDILRFQYEALIGYDADNQIVPGLAESWETSEDGTTWTFTLPADRLWSDGEPITADDVVWTYQAILDDPELGTANGGLVENVEEISSPDDSTVVIQLAEAQATNPGAALPIVPEHVWSDVDAAEYANDTDTVGSGPFTIESYTNGTSVEMVANPNFWRGEPEVPGLTWVVYRNSDAAVQGLRAGEIDVMNGLTPAQFEALDGADGITTNSGAGRRYQTMAINPGTQSNEGEPMGDGNPALADPVLRTAINMAIDRQQLIDRVSQGYAEPGQTQIPTVYPDYFGLAPGTEEVAYDPERANQMLDEAGYEMGPDGVRLDTEGQPLQLRLMGRNTDATHQQMADFIGPWLAEIGIGTDVQMVQPTQVSDDSTLGNYDLYFTGWGIGPDPEFQLSINTCDSRPNADGSGPTSENNFCDPAFDELYEAQRTELDPARRAELVKEAFSLVYASGVNQPLFYADTLEAYRSDNFAPFTTSPTDGGVILSQNSYWGLYSATPATADGAPGAAGEQDGGLPTGAWIGIGIALVAGVGGVLLALSRRRTADERE